MTIPENAKIAELKALLNELPEHYPADTACRFYHLALGHRFIPHARCLTCRPLAALVVRAGDPKPQEK